MNFGGPSDDFNNAFYIVCLAFILVPGIFYLFFHRKVKKGVKMYIASLFTIIIILIGPMLLLTHFVIFTDGLVPYVVASVLIMFMFLVQISFTRWWIKDDKSLSNETVKPYDISSLYK